MIEINQLEAGPQNAAKILACLDRVDGVLNVLPEEETVSDAEVDTLIAEREQARKARNFKRSDEIRDQLKRMGIALEDTPQGTRWKRI